MSKVEDMEADELARLRAEVVKLKGLLRHLRNDVVQKRLPMAQTCHECQQINQALSETRDAG